MIDSESTPPPLKGGKTLAERHAEVLASRPDPFTYAWLQSWKDEVLKAYRGCCHLLNVVTAEIRDLAAKMLKTDERIEVLHNEISLLQTHIGQLQSELNDLRSDNSLMWDDNKAIKKRLDEMAAWGAKIEKQFNQKGGGNAGKN